MKKLISIMLAVVFVFFSAFPAFAVGTNSVSFKTEDVSCAKGRLFTVEVKASSVEKLSAVLFKFTYDKKLIEYRSVKTSADSMVYAYDNGSTLNVSYLCKNGKNINRESTIFTLRFMALAEGECDLSYTAYDCVNSSPASINISQCISGKVRVTKRGSGAEDTVNSKTGQSGKDSIGDGGQNTPLSTDDESIEINSKLRDNTVFMLVVGVLCGLAVAVLCFILYLFVIKRKNKAKTEKASH